MTFNMPRKIPLSADVDIIIDSRCFMCNRCDSETQEADLAEDLVVDGEMFYCYVIWETLLVERILLQNLRIKSG